MIREIVRYPDPILRRIGDRVEKVDDQIRTLAAEMLETMYASNGIGIAAPQVGVSVQLAIVDVSQDPDCIGYLRVNGVETPVGEVCPITFLNPVIEGLGERDSMEEGCLSFPDLRGEIIRPYEVKANLETLDGEVLVIETDGLFARAIQHEVDHLFGRLFIDRMSSARKLAIRRQLKEMQDQFG